MTEAAHNSSSIISIFTSSWRNPSSRMFRADLAIILTALALPWSTSLVAVFVVAWLIAVAFTIDPQPFLRSARNPACLLPVALFLLALAGTLWTDVPWADRLHSVGQVAKLLAIPLLLYHFGRSSRGLQVFAAFLLSCVLVQFASWVVLWAPSLKFTNAWNPGVPVKNYIDQSQEFALCIFALAPITLQLFRARRLSLAAVSTAVMAGFFINMMFVVSARTALLYLAVMLILFGTIYLGNQARTLLFAAAAAAAVMIFFASPYLRDRLENISVDYRNYQRNISGSTGLRLEYWQKSLAFFANAPFFGNGSGSIEHLFEQKSSGQSGLAAEITRNPHNQTLNVAVQWGLLGVGLLYAMWFFHLRLFRGTSLPAWIGLLVVVQNFVSSLLNSHLFDFHEGWIYVLGVGIAGGMMRTDMRAGVPPETKLAISSQPKAG